MANKYIKVDDCVHRGLYLIDARNFGLGVYDKKFKCFYGLRRKFYDEFVFAETHYDADDTHGTAKPLKYIKQCLFDSIEKNEIDFIRWIKEQEKNLKF